MSNKNTRYHFDDKIVESWGISPKNQKVRHNGEFYIVTDAFMEILDDGAEIYHNICKKKDI